MFPVGIDCNENSGFCDTHIQGESTLTIHKMTNNSVIVVTYFDSYELVLVNCL